MPRAPRTKVSKTPSTFLDAIRFVCAITKNEGQSFETHIALADKWATAFNGILSVGHKIDEDIFAYPNANKIEQALSKCNGTMSITLMDAARMSIKSDKFKAIVPCVSSDLMHQVSPDAPCAQIDDRFKEALEIVSVLANENTDSVVTASILMNGQSLLATDRKMVFEAWHGIDLPTNIALPKAFAQPLIKSKKKLVSFGFSRGSCTFYFEDESFIKTQFYADEWPANINNILNKNCNAWSVPKDFFEGVAAIEPFSGEVWFETNMLRSHRESDVGASFECSGVPRGVVYPAKQLLMLKNLAKEIDFVAQGPHDNSYMLMFFGENCRGAIMGRERS
jgi:hypothetical protein